LAHNPAEISFFVGGSEPPQSPVTYKVAVFLGNPHTKKTTLIGHNNSTCIICACICIEKTEHVCN